MTTRNEALEQIDHLIRLHNLTRSDIELLVQKNAPPTEQADNDDKGNLLQRVMMYIGGAFIFMGLCVYIGMVWDDIGSLARVIISLGSGFVAFLLGLFCLSDNRFTRASTPLFMMAAVLQPFGLFVMMDEYLPKTGNIAAAATIVFGFMALQQSLAFIAVKRSSLLFFTLCFYFAFITSLMGWMDVGVSWAFIPLGVAGLMMSWGIAQTKHNAITPFFYFWSAVLVIGESYNVLNDTPFDVVLIGIAAGLIYASVIAKSRAFLTVAVIGLLGYLGYFTDEYFSDIVGWPIAMIIMGFVMIGVSIYAVKLGKAIARKS